MRPARPPRRDGRQYLEALAAEFFGQLPAARKGEAEAIHRLRVSGRRLRAALPLLAADPESRAVQRVRRRLRRLVRAAGLRRDHDVALVLLRKLSAGAARRTEGLQRQLRDDQQRAQQRMQAALRKADARRLCAQLQALARKPASREQTLERMTAQARRERQALRAALARLGTGFDPEALHAERRRLRRLRYAAELQDHLLRRERGAAQVLRRMQTELGELHDAWVLAQWLQGRAARASRNPSLRRLQNRALQAARARHRQWLANDPVLRLESAFRRLLSAPRAARNPP
jgi:CHAD domain-containing protein